MYIVYHFFNSLIGVFGECDTAEQQTEWEHSNVHLVYEHGIFASFVELSSMETE